MTDDGSRSRTRRDVLKASGVLAASGFLAGCTGDSSSGTTTGAGATDTAAATTTPTETATEEETETETEASESYSVSIEPVGEVTFESVPETWVANNGSWADMGVALGLEPPAGVWLPSRYHTRYYDEIPDVSVDGSSIQKLWGDGGIGKEQFYELDVDVHVADPNFLLNRGKWAQSDVDEIAENVGPFFGNSIFSRSYPWHEDYRYYTLYEAFEKLSQVFQRTDRFEAFDGLHEEFQAALAPVVPGRSERPSAAVVWGSGDQPEQFYPYTIDEGTSFKHLNDLQVKDALANTDVKNFYESRGAIDFETLLEVDPAVLLIRGQEAKTADEFQNTVVSFVESHDVASQLTAVQNGDVYRAGPLYQGPITNLVVTERLARTLYGVEEELFDRERVADIVAGDV
ncbi:iron complex transport system substrate-binding protein [Halogeometricum rufum]|uniref:Iron complex transport system substrate-binding protein n=1 Tax=Halogeometricum rufum TaxID=553469 RepID=A0A1I6JBT1_9EURY|nr:ABC transporter substrate-binding protein [Halogeometricum rufum]SFR76374.1 iron complex transport system substrate-binding protein [Halogeometricum rufum]